MSELRPPVDIEFELDQSENVDALRWHVLYTGGFRLTAPTGVAAAVLLVGAMRFNGHPWSRSALIGAGVLALAIVLVVYVFPWIAVLRSPQLSQHFHFVFSDRHIRFDSDQESGIIEWERYNRWREAADFYLLYYDGDQFTVIPKHAFATEGAEQRFVDLLEAHV